ncbi:MAG: hypothetical protein FWD48_04045 [Oscillospiraceae bacterium]|nr:hypothetical protein [Oscillospiraceae bacterium]
MGYKYWMPEDYESLTAFDGFYIENKVFFGASEPTQEQWDNSIADFIKKLKRFLPKMRIVNEWETGLGVRRYVLMRLRDETLSLVMGEDEHYAAIFLILPECCEDYERFKREFDKNLSEIRKFLLYKYPNEVYKRKNTWNLELVTAEKNERRRLVV